MSHLGLLVSRQDQHQAQHPEEVGDESSFPLVMMSHPGPLVMMCHPSPW